MSDKWWETDPKRFLKEIAELKQLCDEDNSFVLEPPQFKDTELLIQGRLTLDNSEKKFLLVYPTLFPLVCPSVRPQENERWSSHQYGEGGTICLEIGPDNWDQAKFSGLDILRSLKSLIDGETKRGEEMPEVASRHEETEGQKLRGSFFRFVIPEGIVATANLPKHGDCIISSTIASETGIMWLNELPKGTVLSVPHGMKHGKSFDRDVKYFILKNPIEGVTGKDLVTVPKFARYLISEQLGEDVAAAFDALEDGTFFLFLFEGSHPLLLRTSRDEEQTRLKVVPSTQFAHQDRTDPKTLEAFEKAKIAIIGLGSVGSKVAVSLARIGVRDFILVDDEILEFGNIVRHEATMADVSAHKVDMVGDLIHHICPVEPIVKKERIRIGGQENPTRYERVLRDVLSADLVIDCTASGEVFQIIAALCSINEKPLVWGEVFAGGIGGIIGCAEPTFTPSPAVVRRALHDYLSVQPEAPYKLESERYQGGPLIADDNSVAIVANMMVFRTKQILLGENDQNETPCWIVGFSKEWIFEQPFEIKRVPCRPEDYPKETNWGKIKNDSVLTSEERKQYDEALKSVKVFVNAN
ncbi:MAG: hypothetical protein B7Y39_01200 [Bdellovibrio sp. 28-41-41]|nr:MAG: hypothetical protein B7Y39_01200 [Bdellovibrio sp. 28-41-41]